MVPRVGEAEPGYRNIRRLDVPVDDAPYMGSIERIGYLDSQVQQLLERQRFAGNDVFQRLAA